MFNKLKQFKDLRSKAKTLQNALAEEKFTVEKHGIKITMDGNQKIQNLEIDRNLSVSDIEKNIPDVFADALKKIQKEQVKKMQSMGGLENFGL